MYAKRVVLAFFFKNVHLHCNVEMFKFTGIMCLRKHLLASGWEQTNDTVKCLWNDYLNALPLSEILVLVCMIIGYIRVMSIRSDSNHSGSNHNSVLLESDYVILGLTYLSLERICGQITWPAIVQHTWSSWGLTALLKGTTVWLGI